MKCMLIQPSDSNLQSSYVASLLHELQVQYGFSIASASDDPTIHKSEKNLIVKTSSKEKGSIGNWLSNKLKYQPTIKKWVIEKVILINHLTKIESQLPQTLIIDNKDFHFSEEDKQFINNHAFSFLTYSSAIQASLKVIFPDKKISFFNPTISSIFKPMNWEESLEIKEKYSDGNDYFLVNSMGQNLDYSINILKGFSIFKKWQKSGMKIIFLTDKIQLLQEAISNYKYREDVSIVNQPSEEELVQLIAASYCTIHLPKEDSDNIFALQSAKCHIPILLRKNSTILEWLENNAFIVDELSSDTLGQAFITMYKAENIRAKHIDFLYNNPIVAPKDPLETF